MDSLRFRRSFLSIVSKLNLESFRFTDSLPILSEDESLHFAESLISCLPLSTQTLELPIVDAAPVNFSSIRIFNLRKLFLTRTVITESMLKPLMDVVSTLKEITLDQVLFPTTFPQRPKKLTNSELDLIYI
jgi:hypothetical protein